MTMRRSWRALWRRTKTRRASRCERGERESEASFIRSIFRGPHLYKDGLVELLRVLQVRFHHNFCLLQGRRFGSIYTACGRLRKESIDYCHLSAAYGSSKLELGRCSDLHFFLFISSGPRIDFPRPSPTRVVD